MAVLGGEYPMSWSWVNQQTSAFRSFQSFNRFAQVKSFTETNTELRNFVVKEDSEISPLRRERRRVKFFIKNTPNFASLCGESSFTVNPEEP